MPNTKEKPTIDQLKCPRCGHRNSFRIEVSEFLLMFKDYKERGDVFAACVRNLEGKGGSS